MAQKQKNKIKTQLDNNHVASLHQFQAMLHT